METRVYYGEILEWFNENSEYYDQIMESIDATYNPGTLDTALITVSNFIEACQNIGVSQEVLDGLDKMFEGLDRETTYVDIT